MGLFGWALADAAAGFAVVDVETTGLYPSTDRVVEVAVVQMDGDAQVTAEFCTLVDPRRDVGPTRIHGLRASDVAGAPVFADVAEELWGLLSGRVLVAHNAPFDARFLDAEFRRCGVRLPPPPLMCTMALSAHYLSGLPARSLVACCEAAGVTLGSHHSALDDAMAAAGLLRLFWAARQAPPGSWVAALAEAAAAAWAPAPGCGRVSSGHPARTGCCGGRPSGRRLSAWWIGCPAVRAATLTATSACWTGCWKTGTSLTASSPLCPGLAASWV